MDNNINVAMFIHNYNKMARVLEGNHKWLEQIICVNCALSSLLQAKDELSEIDSYYIYNTLLMAQALEKKYQGNRAPEVEDLVYYLAEISKLSIKKEDFKRA